MSLPHLEDALTDGDTETLTRSVRLHVFGVPHHRELPRRSIRGTIVDLPLTWAQARREGIALARG